MKEIADRIYLESSYAGVHIGAVILPRGVIFIDAPLIPEDGKHWQKAILQSSSSGNSVLVSMDSHYDRTIGIKAFATPVIAHNSAIRAYETRPNIFKGHEVAQGSVWENTLSLHGTRWQTPEITFDNTLTLNWGREEVKFSHQLGVNPGGIWVEFTKSKVLFVGDTVVIDQPPFFSDASISAWIKELTLLVSKRYNNYTIVSSRSGIVDKDQIKEMRVILQRVLGGLERRAIKKKPIESIQSLANRTLKSYDFPDGLRKLYLERLNYGLEQNYIKNFISEN